MPKLKRKFGLRTKFVMAMLVIGSVPMILGLGITSVQGTNQLRLAIGSNFEGLAKESSFKTDLAMIQGITELEKMAAESPEIREVVLQASKSYQGLSESELEKRAEEKLEAWGQIQQGKVVASTLLLNKASRALRHSLRVSKTASNYIAIFVTDQKGALVASVNRFPDYLHDQSEWWKKTYNQGRGRTYLGNPYYNEKAKTFVMDIAVPILDEERIEVLGFIKEVVDLKAFLKPFIHETRFGKTGHAMLVDSGGKVIICPVLPTGLILPDKDLVRAITDSESGWVTTQDDGHGGKNSIVGFDPVTKVNVLFSDSGGKTWHSFIRQDPKELYAPINSLLYSGSMATAFSLGLLIVMGLFISKKMMAPIHVLHEGAEIIGKGNLKHRLQVKTSDELEQLANEFNTMAETLHQSYSTLEQKVSDRTKELSALNIISTTLNKSLELQEILDETLNKVLDATNHESGMIRIWDDETGMLVLKAHKGLSEEVRSAEVDVKLGCSISGKVANSREPLFIEENNSFGESESPLVTAGFKSIACVPIQSKNKLIGTLTVASKVPRVFILSEKQLLTSIGNQVGTAVENVNHYIREKKMVESLQEMDKMKAEFLSNLSHELRTPLTSIIGFSELMLDHIPGKLNKDQEEYVSHMKESGNHLLELINNLLDLSKIKAGKMEMHVKEFYLPNLVQVVTNMIAPLANKKELRLTTHIEEKLSHIYADEGKLKQCLLNLLSNAVKFTPQGGDVRVKAMSSIFEGQSAVRISVEDSGVGIKKEDADKIFEEFRQAEGSYTREYQGTGLGLPITKRFVELHGGKIWSESEMGKGSKFIMLIPTRISFTSPELDQNGGEEGEPLSDREPLSGLEEASDEIAPQEEEEVRIPEEEPVSDLEVPISVDREGAKPLVILVVEDDPKTSQLLNKFLTQEGYQVELASDGSSALEKAKEIKPFAITLDILLPDMDGWEVLDRLKSMPETQNIPVIIVSITDDQERSLSLGAVGFYSKPIDRKAVLEVLQEQKIALKIKKKPINVLMIDDDPKMIQLVEAFLKPEGIGLIKAGSGEEGINLVLETHPDVIILDLMMPDVNGFDVINRLKEHPTAKNIPIVVCTGKDLTEEDKSTLHGKIREVLHKGQSLREGILQEIRKFEKHYPDKAKMVDGLTGLYNEKYFNNRLSDEIHRLQRFKRPFSLMLANVDHFNKYNQTNGTQAGDRVILEMGEIFRQGLRLTDPVCRHGGSTFSVILPETLREHAHMVGDRLRYLFEKKPFPNEKIQPGGNLTISLGVATFIGGTKTNEEVVTKVNQAIHSAQVEGGNQVFLTMGDKE